jgi:hypothetical protein
MPRIGSVVAICTRTTRAAAPFQNFSHIGGELLTPVCSTSWHEWSTLGRLVLLKAEVDRPLAINLVKRNGHWFRAWISATQEELQTWRLPAID